MERIRRDVFGCTDFARLFISCRKLQLSPFEHCPLAFQCQQSVRILRSRCFVLLILDHGACLGNFPFLASKFFIRQILLDTSFYHCLQSVIIRSSLLLMILHIVQFQYNTVLSFSESRILNLYQPSKMSSDGICVIDNRTSSHFEANS